MTIGGVCTKQGRLEGDFVVKRKAVKASRKLRVSFRMAVKLLEKQARSELNCGQVAERDGFGNGGSLSGLRNPFVHL